MLMAEKVDRRVRKTKAQLRAGLARLMQKKSIKDRWCIRSSERLNVKGRQNR